MGARNVAKAYTYWSTLDHLPMRALCFVSLHALDDDDPPRFWGGWEAIAIACGQELSDDQKKRARKRRYASDVMAQLIKAGAVVSSGQARAGVRAEYALALDPGWTYKPTGTGRNVSWTRAPRTARQSEVGTSSPGTSATPTAGTEGTRPSGTTGTRSAGTQGTTPGTTEEYKEEEEETQATKLGAREKFDAQNHPKENLTEEIERQRQLEGLRKLMTQEDVTEEVNS